VIAEHAGISAAAARQALLGQEKVGAALLITRHATRKHQIPFGPFMITGAFLAILAVGT
jgi:prepilin signal peptidase PulO-like enzyme (type II secretory pathway)